MMTKKIVLVVDFQTDFLNLERSKLPIPDSKELMAPMAEYLMSISREDTAVVLFTQDWHSKDHVEYMPDGTPFPSHCVEFTPGAEIAVNPTLVDTLLPTYFLKKNAFDMWEEDSLEVTSEEFDYDRDDFFEDLKAKGFSEVEVVGVALNVCVNFAVRGLVDRGFVVTVRKDLTKGIDTGNGDYDMVAEKVFEDINVTIV